MALLISDPITLRREPECYAGVRTKTTMERLPKDLPVLWLSAVLTGPFNHQHGVHLGPATKSYLTDPESEPDPDQWKTEVRYEILR